MTARTLIVEDDPDFAFSLERALQARGLAPRVVTTGGAALDAARATSFDVIVLDLGLPDQPGEDVLVALRDNDPFASIIVLTGRDDASTAVRALKRGASHYLTKPVAIEELYLAIDHIVESARLRRHVEARARAERPLEDSSGGAVGRSPRWQAAQAAIRAAAAARRTSVLITGESGTGKERSARQIHAWSERASGPFVTINAASLAPSLLESELFGHEAGAFTGARGARRGVFELASGGTLFLDEVGELPLDLQPKLLRVLDGHPVRRLGGERDVHIDVRLVSATNRELDKEVRASRFRLDLYHRLRVVEIRLPPVRARGDDVPLLLQHFLEVLSRELAIPLPPRITPAALEALVRYRWPGNVRELRNVLERALVLGRGADIDLGQLPPEIVPDGGTRSVAPPPEYVHAPGADERLTLDDALRAHVLRVFRACEGNVTRAARVLDVSRNKLKRHLRAAGIVVGDEPPSTA